MHAGCTQVCIWQFLNHTLEDMELGIVPLCRRVAYQLYSVTPVDADSTGSHTGNTYWGEYVLEKRRHSCSFLALSKDAASQRGSCIPSLANSASSGKT